jgi:hypothetical protein
MKLSEHTELLVKVGTTFRMYFVFIYGNRIVKSVEIVLRRHGEGMRENDGVVNLIKIYCKHLCKCHNVVPCTALYANIKIIL